MQQIKKRNGCAEREEAARGKTAGVDGLPHKRGLFAPHLIGHRPRNGAHDGVDERIACHDEACRARADAARLLQVVREDERIGGHG